MVSEFKLSNLTQSQVLMLSNFNDIKAKIIKARDEYAAAHKAKAKELQAQKKQGVNTDTNSDSEEVVSLQGLNMKVSELIMHEQHLNFKNDLVAKTCKEYNVIQSAKGVAGLKEVLELIYQNELSNKLDLLKFFQRQKLETLTKIKKKSQEPNNFLKKLGLEADDK